MDRGGGWGDPEAQSSLFVTVFYSDDKMDFFLPIFFK